MKLDLEVLHHGCMWQSSPARDAYEEPVCQSVFALVQICTNVDNIVSRGQNKVARCSLLAEGFTCAGEFVLMLQAALIKPTMYQCAMKTEKCRWLKCNRQTRASLRRNPNGNRIPRSGDPGGEIRRTSPRAIEDQQLVFGENGFCHDGSHTTRSKDAHNRGDDVDKEDNQSTHARF